MQLLDRPVKSNGGDKRPAVIRNINPLEAEIIALFVQLGRVLGQPRSFAEIYGLLFISRHPLALDDLIERLGLSKGSASQGLKFLRNAGAIQIVYVQGSRRVHYQAVAELRNLVTRYLRDQVLPHLDGGLDRLEGVARMVGDVPKEDRAHVSARITMLKSWGKKSRNFLPLIVKILGK